jgi:hypothetical protein
MNMNMSIKDKEIVGILTNFVNYDLSLRIMTHNPDVVEYIPSMKRVKVDGQVLMDHVLIVQAYDEIDDLYQLYNDLVVEIDATCVQTYHFLGYDSVDSVPEGVFGYFFDGYPVHKVVLDYTKLFKSE